MFRTSLAVLGLTFALPFAPAHAVLQLTADVGGTMFSCFDGQAGCDIGGPGTIQLNTPTVINGVSVSGSISQAVLTGLLTSNSISVVNTNATPITIDFSVSATNFVGPASFVNTTGSGTFVNGAGSSITMNWLDDPANTQGAVAGTVPGNPGFSPGNLVRTFAHNTTTNNLDSFSDNFSGALANPDGPLYSMTMDFHLVLAPGAQLNSRGQAEQKTFVPEPASLALLGTGLLGFGLIRRRRKN